MVYPLAKKDVGSGIVCKVYIGTTEQVACECLVASGQPHACMEILWEELHAAQAIFSNTNSDMQCS